MARVIHLTRQTLAWCLAFVLGGLFVFWLLLRVSTHSYLVWQYSGTVSTLLGTGASFMVLWLSSALIRFYFKIQQRFTMGIATVALLYVFYALHYVSLSNVKATDMREEYGVLHPSLRLALGTLFVFNPESILTDLSREPDDYNKMGLKQLNHSLHYIQDDGYVHAVDLRTRDRSERENHWMILYFKSIGLNTKRHTGTADHLHVSLPLPESTAI